MRLIGSERVVEPIELLRLQDGEATETEAAQLRAMVRSVDWMEPEFSAAGGKLRWHAGRRPCRAEGALDVAAEPCGQRSLSLESA